MENEAAPLLTWIDQQQPRMRELVIQWARINSGSYHLDGLARLSQALRQHYSGLGGELTEVPLAPQHVIDSRGDEIDVPLGKALSIRKRSDVPHRVFLGIHMDTVYGADDPFQTVNQIDPNTLRGPGVVDAKGGLVVMLVALEALERSPMASRVGWEVLINPDEEIGSPGSADLFVEAAARNHLGLVFEPTFPDGALVGERKGSGNYNVVFHGRSAHAGRDFHAGRNAVLAAADFAVAANRINGTLPDVTVNVGRIDGGGPVNIVPDRAVCRLNARASDPNHPPIIESELRRIAADVAARHEVSASVHGKFLSPPKRLDAATLSLLR